MIKTNAMRILDSNNIEYKEYVLDIKEALDGVVPVAAKLDLKKAANSVGEKNVEMIPMKELLKITGYVHGGCSPIGMKKVFNTVIDETAILFDKIIFSGGKIGFFIEVNPLDVEKVIPVKFIDIVEEV